jgi:hypothetical protein
MEILQHPDSQITRITAADAITEVRGLRGASAWIALITGVDKKFGLARKFCPSRWRGHDPLAPKVFYLHGPGIYEFRNFCVRDTRSGWQWSGFLKIRQDGTIEQLTKNEVMAEIQDVITRLANLDTFDGPTPPSW